MRLSIHWLTPEEVSSDGYYVMVPRHEDTKYMFMSDAKIVQVCSHKGALYIDPQGYCPSTGRNLEHVSEDEARFFGPIEEPPDLDKEVKRTGDEWERW